MLHTPDYSPGYSLYLHLCVLLSAHQLLQGNAARLTYAPADVCPGCQLHNTHTHCIARMSPDRLGTLHPYIYAHLCRQSTTETMGGAVSPSLDLQHNIVVVQRMFLVLQVIPSTLGQCACTLR